MKKVIFIFAIILTALTSCEKDAPIDNIKDKPISKIHGDNEYDVLGFAFDATKEYLDINSPLLQVIDVEQLKANTDLIITHYPTQTILDIQSGHNEKDLLVKFNNKFSAKTPLPINGVPFSGTFNSEITVSNKIVSKYSHAMANVNVYVAHHAIMKEASIEILQNYLTTQFKNNIQNMTPEQLISVYGTHVYTDIYTGGSVRFKYKSIITNNNKELSVAYGAKLTLEELLKSSFELSNDTKLDVTSKSEFKDESVIYKSRGGATGVSIFGVWTPGTTIQPINFNQWSSTVKRSEANALQLIDIGDNSLIALYEFVADPAKKAALKTAIENYLVSKSISLIPVVPLYRYKHRSTGNHFYTTDWTELGNGNSSWEYIKIEAFVCETQLENTVPFYRFYRTYKKFLGKTYFNHYYTRTYSSGTQNYGFERIQCYVYPTNLNGTTPLYQTWNPDLHDHFYTTNTSEIPAGYGSKTECGYVYK
ncbi:MAG: hypothetical protein KA206_06360 [Paludibacter sp.]|jgi:hypothetical protein|nr:hypothetical protein [Paludibacter sp.]